MPLHPSIVVMPLALAFALAGLDLARLRFGGAPLRMAALGVNVALVAACLGAVMSGQAEGGRIATDPALLSQMTLHARLATVASLSATALLFVRAARWRLETAWTRRLVAAMAVGLLGLVLFTGRQGGRLVFEHGAGVRRPPWDIDPMKKGR